MRKGREFLDLITGAAGMIACLCIAIGRGEVKYYFTSFLFIAMIAVSAYRIYENRIKNRNMTDNESEEVSEIPEIIESPEAEKDNKKYCTNCGNYSDSDKCEICGERIR